jgi:undecaprenyl-phosphate 4-deoxy-4-formamido-L-arabinose transferase
MVEMLAESISVVVPVYNSEASLPLLIQRLEPVLKKFQSAEVILVNDGSHDGSWAVVEDLVARFDFVRGIDLMRNYGQHNALLCGIRSARSCVIVTMDDDMQNPPEEIPLLVAKLREGYDVVYGTPEEETHGFLRDMASRITKLALQSAMGAQTARNVSAFRAFCAPLREVFATYRGPFVSIDVLLTWATTRFAAVAVKHDARRLGRSGYTLGRLIAHALNMMTGFSTLPLQLASIVGFTFTLFGMCSLLYVLIRYLLHGGTVPGFAFLASLISILSGAQLFALGVIGEYLSRMHFRMMERPPYSVRLRTYEN